MIKWNLQQFAGEKTEKPTPRRLQEARKKGQVPRSPELQSALILLGSILIIKMMSGFYIDNFLSYMKHSLTANLTLQLTEGNAGRLFADMGLVSVKFTLPIVAIVFVIGFMTAYLQVGSHFTVEPIIPKLEKMDPIQGVKRIFALRTLVELAKSIIKILLVGYLVYDSIVSEIGSLSNLSRMDIPSILSVVGGITFEILWKSALLLLVLAIFDFFYQRYDHERSLRMSKEDIKDEFKKTEGNPTIKGKIKERQRAMAMRRMMQEVPKADVVITNPTHFAVAIQYDGDKMEAPVVIAKGTDDLAQRIKQIAKENGVVLVENKPLAQTLYKTVEIGETIPQELFQAVAEVLAYVYRLKRKV
ncbi:flagellar biosynthesis protein FlhB [Effusibacillus lacus]|uniref:Flagellar biosynthetic protein FlhB n=1 Tax=Effusibacillus lacus TaxID=1348429 RepID=A0A292YNQ3_9BACL|nr:flagellar biosynthesis protein FlhB [Effusibacillus lacus]TCS73135.1 flagellar biosynthetic protein FlhB [Effusibacillus lacus]GAX90539.1 flagellar biosynthesis protein FlhB [Effusibacillus lacus]